MTESPRSRLSVLSQDIVSIRKNKQGSAPRWLFRHRFALPCAMLSVFFVALSLGLLIGKLSDDANVKNGVKDRIELLEERLLREIVGAGDASDARNSH